MGRYVIGLRGCRRFPFEVCDRYTLEEKEAKEDKTLLNAKLSVENDPEPG